MRILYQMADRWKFIGIRLGLHVSDIQRFKADYTNSDDCLLETIKMWLRRNYDIERHGKPTWTKLAQVV